MAAINTGKPGQIISYIDKQGNTQEVRANYGDAWSDLETDDSNLNSIFNKADINKDDTVQANELNLLNRLVQYANKLFGNKKGDDTVKNEGLAEVNRQLNAGEIAIEQFLQEKSNPSATNWSEGLDRNIGTISISDSDTSYLPPVYQELQAIGDEQGFTVNRIQSGGDPWVEDSSIRRADNKQYVQYYAPFTESTDSSDVIDEFQTRRRDLSTTRQGRVANKGTSADLQISSDNKYYGTSYLEGGNILNTVKADGKAGAVVGEESIAYTLAAAGKKNTPENVAWAKEQIAEDLGLKTDDVTYIPQLEFHIDMTFRPLHNGQIAIPDYDKAIEILEGTEISSMTAEQKEKHIAELRELSQKSKEILADVEQRLTDDNYQIVRIPCFTSPSNETTNFMNGVGGTSDKTGQSFYITNRSPHAELNDIITQHFQQAGIDKVYFVSTADALINQGGIDCLTQEAPKM